MQAFSRRDWLAQSFAASLALGGVVPARAQTPSTAPSSSAAPTPAATLGSTKLVPGNGKPFRIYAITFRGMTDVEKGFEEYFRSRKIAVEITYRDLNRDASRLPAYLDEIRATRPDLIYTWGTSVTLGVVGPHDAPDRSKFINDIPVVFTLVASPVLAKIVPEGAATRSHITGATHVAPTAAQIQAMAAYRPFQTLGVLYTPTEKNSVVVLDQIRKLGREKNFNTVERMFRLDANRKPSAEGAAEIVREIKEAGAQWLYLPPDSFLGTLAQEVVIPAAMQVGLPTFASTEQLMQAGALSGLVCRYFSIGQYTAHKAEQVLVGKVKPSTIPVDTLKRFSYQVRMAAALRLNMPPPLPMFSYAELIKEDNPV
jgi:putative tryptophan/tyrosine transport system substrate-binding protein